MCSESTVMCECGKVHQVISDNATWSIWNKGWGMRAGGGQTEQSKSKVKETLAEMKRFLMRKSTPKSS